MGNHLKAIKDFIKAISLNKAAADSYFYRGNSRVEINKFQEAIEDYNQ